MTNGGGAQGVRYYSSFAVNDSEDGEGHSAYEPIWRRDWKNSLSGVRRTGALWWTLGLVVGCSAAIALYSNTEDRTNSKYIEMVYNTGAVGDMKKHRLSGEFYFICRDSISVGIVVDSVMW